MTAKVSNPHEFRMIGQPMPVADDRRFVSGRGRYINDLDFPGMLHLGVLSASVAHANLLSVDVSEARALPGVVAVITGADLLDLMEPIPQEFDLPHIKWYPLATDKIRYAGEWVVAIVATSRAIAEDAAELVSIDYEELAPLVDPVTAMAPEAALLHPAHGSNLVWQETNTWGEVDAAFAGAEHVFEYDYRWNRHSGVPIETFGAIAAVAPSGLLELWASHQNPGIQSEASHVLRRPLTKVHMDVDVGGSYGSKRGRKQMYLVGVASILTGRPVKFIEDRIENMQAGDGHGPDRLYKVKVAADRTGLIQALDIEIIEDLGAYCGRGPRQVTKPISAVVGPYRIKNVRYGGFAVLTCKTNQVPFRGAGQSPHNFALERTMDRVARELDIDPLEIRLRNFIQADEFPYVIPSGATYDSGNYPGACELAVEKADLRGLREMQLTARQEGRLIGIGLAGGIAPSGGAVDAGESARVQIDKTGSVFVTLGFQSCGQAHSTMVTQIVCEELGIAPEKVIVQRGDGMDGLVGSAPIGSRMTLMLGSAVKGCTGKLHDKLKELAAHVLEANPDDIVADGTDFHVAGTPTLSVSLEQLTSVAYGPRKGRPAELPPGLVADSTFAGPPGYTPRGNRAFPSYAYDFHVVVVEIDPETFDVTLRKYLVVHDCGTVINPLVVDGFVLGGIGHGVGGALYEHFTYDESGQLTAASFMDYLLPTAAEIPHVEMHSLVTESPLHPYGAKGAAEGAYMTAPAAISGAIEDAIAHLGMRIDEIPVTPTLLFDKWVAAQSPAADPQEVSQ